MRFLEQISVIVLLSVCVLSAWADSTINESNNCAYAANAGWINCRPDSTNGAVICEFCCSNYLYGANIGWIHLGDGSPTNGYEYSNTSAADYGVNHNEEGRLWGFAWGANIGWLVFETNGNPRIDLTTGRFSGYVWSANVGWIGLSNAQAYVQTESFAQGPDLDGDGIPDMWECEEMGTTNINILGAGSDYDSDGVLDFDEYLADTDPKSSSEYLRITDIMVINGTNAQLTWASEPSRMYWVNKSGSLTNAAGWTDSELGLQSPDAGATTVRTVPGEVVTQRFFRVKAVRPLSE